MHTYFGALFSFFEQTLYLFTYRYFFFILQKQVVQIKNKIDSNDVYLEPGIGAEEIITELPDLNMDDFDQITQEIIDGFGSPSKMMRRDNRGETPKKVPVKAANSSNNERKKEKIDIVAKITLGKEILRDFF